MTFWKVLLVILLAIWLLSRIRVGGRVRYGRDGLFAALLVGPVRIQLLPVRKKPAKRKKKRKKPEKPEKPKPEAEETPGTLGRLMELLPVAAEAAGALKRKIRIDDLKLDLIWGGTDAAAIALGYGKANAAVGMIWPLFDHNFKVKRHEFRIALDYERREPGAELEAAVTMTLGQITALSVRYGVKALRVWIKSGKPAEKDRRHKA